MSVRFVPGLENGIADVMSRWGVKSGSSETIRQEKDVLDVFVVFVMQWSKLHEGHVGLSTMQHREKQLKLGVTAKEMKHMLSQCKVC